MCSWYIIYLYIRGESHAHTHTCNYIQHTKHFLNNVCIRSGRRNPRSPAVFLEDLAMIVVIVVGHGINARRHSSGRYFNKHLPATKRSLWDFCGHKNYKPLWWLATFASVASRLFLLFFFFPCSFKPVAVTDFFLCVRSNWLCDFFFVSSVFVWLSVCVRVFVYHSVFCFMSLCSFRERLRAWKKKAIVLFPCDFLLFTSRYVV